MGIPKLLEVNKEYSISKPRFKALINEIAFTDSLVKILSLALTFIWGFIYVLNYFRAGVLLYTISYSFRQSKLSWRVIFYW